MHWEQSSATGKKLLLLSSLQYHKCQSHVKNCLIITIIFDPDSVISL